MREVKLRMMLVWRFLYPFRSRLSDEVAAFAVPER